MMGQRVFCKRLFDDQVILGPDMFWGRGRIVNAETAVVNIRTGGFLITL